MDPALFAAAPLRLRERLQDIRIEDRLTFFDTTNTVYMTYAGRRVRNEGDVRTILAAPVAHRVNAIVNYDGSRVDDEAMTAYMDA